MTAAEGAALSAESYNEFVAGITLGEIVTTKLSAERTGPGEAGASRFDIQGGVAVEDGTLQCQFTVTAHILTDEDQQIGSVEVVLVTLFGANPQPSPAAAEQFARTSAATIAMPYLREAVASAALRVGFPGVTMPLYIAMPSQEGQFAGDPASGG